MASMLSRASLNLARAARQVALAARRAASVTASRSPTSDLRTRRLSQSIHSGATNANIPGSANRPPHERVEFVASDKDLESNEALWALYGRWCEFYDEERDHDGMVRRFDTFKEAAFRVDRVNKANLPYTLKLSQYADGKLAELMCNRCFGREPPPDPADYREEGKFFIYDGGDDVPIIDPTIDEVPLP
ncbi:hypothetical protein D1007_17417 [Hordeum vulgare]|nr:hypothetical protein D1007_17417 [Hordeum vulgare]KAI5022413.1 hypothetical protein ZWY2020_059143 [Hordeum vulgare]